jgi:hypothetical protein
MPYFDVRSHAVFKAYCCHFFFSCSFVRLTQRKQNVEKRRVRGYILFILAPWQPPLGSAAWHSVNSDSLVRAGVVRRSGMRMIRSHVCWRGSSWNRAREIRGSSKKGSLCHRTTIYYTEHAGSILWPGGVIYVSRAGHVVAAHYPACQVHVLTWHELGFVSLQPALCKVMAHHFSSSYHPQSEYVRTHALGCIYFYVAGCPLVTVLMRTNTAPPPPSSYNGGCIVCWSTQERVMDIVFTTIRG